MKNKNFRLLKKNQRGLDIEINSILLRAANPNTSKLVAEQYEKQAEKSIRCQTTYKAKQAEIKEVLQKINDMQTKFGSKSEPITVEELFKSEKISRELINVFIQKVVINNDNIEITLKEKEKTNE